MKILIGADSHDNWNQLEKAVAYGNEALCDLFLHAGDFISPPGIDVLANFKGHVHIVWGNNEGEKVGMLERIRAHSHITHHGDSMDVTFDTCRFYMNHYPAIGENAARASKYDVVVYGHTHLYHEEHIGATLLINPGELQGYRTGTSTAILFDTDRRTVLRVDFDMV
jgi:uncharacterized protein